MSDIERSASSIDSVESVSALLASLDYISSTGLSTSLCLALKMKMAIFPEIGTLRAEHRPIIVITSNRTREIHDALKRRCVYYWIDYPTAEKEIEIVRLNVPGVSQHLASQIVNFVKDLREQELYKLPGVAETLDWAEALGYLQAQSLDELVVDATLGLLRVCDH